MDPKRSPINYLYFGGLFFLLVLLIAASIFSKESLGGSHIFFFLYALGQVILEVFLFAFFGLLIRHYFGNFSFALFIGATFVILILHTFDFLMDRVLDLSVWSAVRIFILDENLENFLYLLDASGIPLWIWSAFSLLLVALPLLGILLYKLSDLLARKKPLSIRHSLFLQTFLCIPAALLFWDYSASNIIDPDAYTSFLNSLPWKRTFLSPETVSLSLPGPPIPPDHALLAAAIDSDTTLLTHKPNIYLFIIESLRADVITPEIAPHLHRFKTAYPQFDLAFSNANASHLSWYSIFHSQFSHSWTHSKKTATRGSPPLALLKKWGYQIRLYSSAQLGYYGMDKLLFGTDLLDSAQYFHHAPPLQAADTDAAALAKLQQDLRDNPSLQQGQLFIIFWDCTHFDYSWPKNWTPKFTPFSQNFSYFQAFHSQKALHQLKNRYRNAVNYMDSLFGQFFHHLPNQQESIVIISGDHGEEFFERGHLFHLSHISHQQTHIPLYFKFGDASRPFTPRSVISQVDIFPTLIDYLSHSTSHYLAGSSLFQQPKWPYALISRFNAGSPPYEFCLHDGAHKLIAQYSNRADIFASTHLRLLSLRTLDDTPLRPSSLHPFLETHFSPAFTHLFKEKKDK